jgi:CdiA C-terminal tRNase domain
VDDGGALIGIPNATRLTAAEQATAARLQAQRGVTLQESTHLGAEYVDDMGRTYDALGNPRASQFWNEAEFLESIDSHLLKANDFTVLDLTGFPEVQKAVVRRFVNGLPQASQAKIIRIGF